jgi:hypothetical protein
MGQLVPLHPGSRDYERSGAPRGVFVAQLSRAGAYVVWCTVGGQAVVGWPRVIQVVPGSVEADASVWRAEAATMALTSELALTGGGGGGGMGLAQRRGGDVSVLRAEVGGCTSSRIQL